MNIFNLQEQIFNHTLTRQDLLAYKPIASDVRKVNIIRNHSFELIENSMGIFLNYAKIKCEFLYSDYDDSLSFSDLDDSADLNVLWLDLGRYSIGSPEEFLNERVDRLLSIVSTNILVVCVRGRFEMVHERIINYPTHSLQSQFGQKFFDLRMETFSGTPLSSNVCNYLSKDLALNYFSTLLKGNLKCIIVDLDNTLYEGVLGEDGVDGIVFSDGHREIQKTLRGYKDKGFFICISSKNEHSDVVKLLNENDNFLLKENDFDIIKANWNSKSQSIEEILDSLNIGQDSAVFIDDNLGELFEVRTSLSLLHQIHAQATEPRITNEVLQNYPSLRKFSVTIEDNLRARDAKANLQRRELLSAESKEDYLRGLSMLLEFRIDARTDVKRVSELSNKTNQFIFNYKRYTIADVERIITSKNSVLITISLSDKLSTSGIIGVVVGRNEGEFIIDECFVSCRALGRGIDDAIVLGALKFASDYFEQDNLKVEFQRGERNTPAVQFIEKYLSRYTRQAAKFSYQFPLDLIEIRLEK